MEKQMAVYYNRDFVFDASKIEIDLTIREGNNKPMRAFWTSSVIADDGYLSSDWIYFCIGDYLAEWEVRPVKYIFVPKKNLKIYEIDSVEDYLSSELKKRKPSYSYSSMKSLIDYEAMREAGYDGIHFTANGAHLGHCWSDDVPSEVRNALNPMDVESTVWLRPDWFESFIEEDSWFDYTWLSVRDEYQTEEKWYENYDESDCGHLLS